MPALYPLPLSLPTQKGREKTTPIFSGNKRLRVNPDQAKSPGFSAEKLKHWSSLFSSEEQTGAVTTSSSS